ncbi:MAG: NAD-dependent epimerase/dehydratase family protein [Verrucomicrobiota bacterium]
MPWWFDHLGGARWLLLDLHEEECAGCGGVEAVGDGFVAKRRNRPQKTGFCSSRTVYGKPREIPVPESHPVAPQSIYAVHKLALEHYLSVLRHTRGMPFLVVRLSNVYGPFTFDQDKSYGVFSPYIHQAQQGETLRVFGDGTQVRDFIFIRDAIDCFLRLATHPDAANEIVNLDGPESVTLANAVQCLLGQCPAAKVEHETWPKEYQAIETGDYKTDLSKLQSLLGEPPGTTVMQGIEETLEAYRDTRR